MKKQEAANKEEKLGLYRPYPHEIIRGTKADGSVDYFPVIDRCKGTKLETWEEEAEMTVECMLERFDALAEILGNEEEMKYSLLLRNLVSETKRTVEDMFEIINRDLGTIECTYLKTINFSDRGPCVGARLGKKAIEGKYVDDQN